MGAGQSAGKTVDAPETEQLVTTTTTDRPASTDAYKEMMWVGPLSPWATAAVVFAVFSMLSLMTGVVLYAYVLDRADPNFFNPNSESANKKSSAYNVALGFAIGALFIGLIMVLYLSVMRHQPAIVSSPKFEIVGIWEGIILAILFGFGTVYMITMVGIVNSDCDDYAICTANILTGATSERHEVHQRKEWTAILAFAIITVVLSWITLILVAIRNYKGYK